MLGRYCMVLLMRLSCPHVQVPKDVAGYADCVGLALCEVVGHPCRYKSAAVCEACRAGCQRCSQEDTELASPCSAQRAASKNTRQRGADTALSSCATLPLRLQRQPQDWGGWRCWAKPQPAVLHSYLTCCSAALRRPAPQLSHPRQLLPAASQGWNKASTEFCWQQG